MNGLLMSADNKLVYDSLTLATEYGIDAKLQPPEQTILDSIKHELQGARMLDIGVGGGRTTVHFAPLVASYVGVDYSEAMIAVCKKRFPETGPGLDFHVADARSLSMFAAGAFDFVLFSYNGLDYIPHEDRRLALSEIRRVLRPGGRFAFSTHNLNNLRKRLRPAFSLNPKAFASKLLWLYGFLRHNKGLFNLGASDYCEVYDGALGYRLRTHYVTPEYALEELTRSGFHDSTIFELATGQAITATQGRHENAEDWLYYLTTAGTAPATFDKERVF